MKANSRMLLAIGGPKNFEWLPDYGYQSITVPIMPKIVFKNEPHPTDLLEYDTAVYYKHVIYSPESRLRKEVYVEMDYLEDPIVALKNYLLEQFMLMEDPTS